MAKSFEELEVWQRARRLAEAVFALTERVRFRENSQLREQLNNAADSVLSNIGEGFGQPSDRGFARYLGIARGSSNEVVSHLVIAEIRRLIGREESVPLRREAGEISRMLSGLIKYLHRCDRKQRF
jgi:four helix bundle protein